MADGTPALADATPVADAADATLLDDAAPAAGDTPAPEPKADDKPAAESKPDAKASGDDEKGEAQAEPDLLADDDEGKSPEDKDGPADKSKDGAPETYEAFTLPDGMELDEKAMAKATPVLKELGHDQEKAQKLVSLFAELQQEAAAQQLAGFNQVKRDWYNAFKSDPEFGGDKFDQSRGAAKAVLAKYGDKELVNDLKEWGWINHPGLAKLLARVNADLSEDKLERGDPASQSRPKTVAERLYPNMPGDNQ